METKTNVIRMTVPKYLRHKVDLVRCFTVNLSLDQLIGQIEILYKSARAFEKSILIAFSNETPDTNTLV